jgi:hypothetical protein
MTILAGFTGEDSMAVAFPSALAVKELEPGEFHWILLQEENTSDDLLNHAPETFSEPHRDAAAAWAAGYLVIRAAMRRAAAENAN